MLLYPVEMQAVEGTPAPTYVLPAATASLAGDPLGSEQAQLARAGRQFVGGGVMRHVRLSGVRRDLSPMVEVALVHGTLRAAYLQRGRCAISASGISPDGAGESSSCGESNEPGCLIGWMAKFNAYQPAKLYQPDAALRAPALSSYAVRGSPTHLPTYQTHSPTHPLTHSPTHPRTHAPTQPLTHSPTHPLTHSPTHPLTHSPTYPQVRRPGPAARRLVALARVEC